MASKVLIVTPDAHRAGVLAEAFAQKGAMPTLAFNTEQLMQFVESEHFHLVTFDQRAADECQPGLVRSALEQSNSLLLLLSNGDAYCEFVDALGARSHVAAGAPPSEIATAGTLLAEIAPETISGTRLAWQRLELDTGRREGFWDGRPLQLTKHQFRVLTALVQAEGNVVSCERLSRVVYGDAIPDDGQRMLAHIRRIRKKIEPVPSRPRYLLTVRGEGFRLAEPLETRADL
jgi:two-component system KDP operon response regulator KdpE